MEVSKSLEDYAPGDKILPYEIVGKWKGSELVGMKYSQLMKWVKPSGEA